MMSLLFHRLTIERWHPWFACKLETQPMIYQQRVAMIDNQENHDNFYGWNHWAQKNEFFHCLFQRLMKKITASSSRAGARVPYALFELPVESGRRKSHWQQPRYLTRSHSALLLLHCLSYSSDSVAPQQKRAAALKPLSQTIFSRTTTETQPAAHSKAINGGKMAFKLLCCRLPVFTFNFWFCERSELKIVQGFALVKCQ